MFDRQAYNRTYHLERYHSRMGQAKDQLGGQCAHCGSPDDLQLDHIDPATKAFTLSQNYGVPEDQWQSELAKCQLLCGDCHRLKTASEQRSPLHGAWGMAGRPKCRCSECRDFINAYHRAYKRKWRASKK